MSRKLILTKRKSKLAFSLPKDNITQKLTYQAIEITQELFPLSDIPIMIYTFPFPLLTSSKKLYVKLLRTSKLRQIQVNLGKTYIARF